MKRKLSIVLLATICCLVLALGSVSIFAADYVKLECEAADDLISDDGALKTEETKGTNVGDIGNVGATSDGAYLVFSGVDFTGNGASKVTIQYCNNSGRCAEDAYAEIRLGDDGGELLATIEMPATGDNWSTYATVSADLSKVIKGKQDIAFVMYGTTDGDHPFIGNFDFITFTEAAADGDPADKDEDKDEKPADKDEDKKPADKDETPKTADTSLMLLLSLIFVSGVGAAVVSRKVKE